MVLPNVWKHFKQPGNKSVTYMAILQKRSYSVHCYVFGMCKAIHVMGHHWYDLEPGEKIKFGRHFSAHQAMDYDLTHLLKTGSGMIIDAVWPTIDFDELARLLGRPVKEW